MALAGALEIQIYAELARLRSDMQAASGVVETHARQINASVDQMKRGLEALGISLSAAAFVAIIRGSVDAMDHLNDLSKSTGLLVEQLAGLKIAARQSGTDLDSLAGVLNKLSANIGKNQEKFAALGITARDPLEAFKQLSDIFNQTEDQTLKAALGAATLGKNWAAAAPLLAEGSRKIGELVDQGAKLSGIDREMARAADEFNDKLVLLTGTHGLINREVGRLLPLLNTMADDLIDLQRKSEGTDSNFGVLKETFRAIVVLGGNVSFVMKGIGTEIGVLLAQLVALAEANSALQRFDIEGVKSSLRQFNAIGQEAAANAEKARADFDSWENRMMAVGSAARSLAKDMGELDQVERAAASAAASASRERNAATAARVKTFVSTADPSAFAAQLELVRVQLKIQLEAIKDFYANAQTISDAYHSAGLQSDEAFYAQKRVALALTTAAEISALEKSIALETQIRAKAITPADQIKADIKLAQDRAAMAKLVADAAAKGIVIDLEETQAIKATNAAMAEQDVALAALNKARDEANAVIQQASISSREEIEQLKFETSLIGQTVAAQAQLTAGRKADLALRQAIAALPQDDQGNFLEGGAEAFEKLQADFAKFKAALLGLTQDQTTKQWMKDLSDSSANLWRQAGSDIEDSLTKAFGVAGTAAGGMVKAYADARATQRDLDKKFREDIAAAPAKQFEIEQKYNNQSAENSLKMYGDMAGAAASFFGEQTAAHKALAAVEKAMYAVRLVMQLEDLAVSLGIISVKNGANLASIGPAIAAGAAQMFAQSGWGGFIGVAAMLAVMAGLGFSGGGGGGASLPSAADAQKTQGTGTVLGDSAAKSQSIDNALKQIQSIDQLGLTYTRQMTEYLTNISNNMSSLVGALARVTGLTNPTQSGISQGTSPTGIHSIVNASNSIIDPLGGFSLIPGNNALLNRIFGTITTNIINSGIAMIGTVADALKAPLIDNQANVVRGINSFFTVNTTTTGLFGGSNVNHDEWRSLPDGTVRQLQGFLSGVVDSVEAAAKALGIWTPQLRDLLLSMPLDVKLSLDGLKGQELTDAVNAFFSSIADKIALGVPTLAGANGITFDSAAFFETFQKAGEGAFETLVRVATEFETVNHTFDMLGLHIGLTGMAAMKATDNIVQLSGGLDKFQQQAADFVSKYYSPQEQHDMTGRALGTEFANAGVAMPTDPAGFRHLIEGIDLTTEAGQKLYARLMGLEGTFYDWSTQIADSTGKMHSATEAAEQHLSLQQQLDVLTGKKTQDQIDYENELAGAIGAANLQLVEDIHTQKQINEYKQHERDINQTNFELQNQLDVLTGKRSQKDLDRAVRMDQITAQLGITTNDTTIALQKQIWKQQDYAEALATQQDLFSQFATPAQKAAQATIDATAALAPFNIAIPRTNEEMAALVASIDTTTSSGQALLAVLKLVAPSLHIVIDEFLRLPQRYTGPTIGAVPVVLTSGLGGGGLGGLSGGGSITPLDVIQKRVEWQEKLDLLEGKRTQNEIDHQHALEGVTDKTTIALINQYYAQLDLNEAAKKVTDAIEKAGIGTSTLSDAIKNNLLHPDQATDIADMIMDGIRDAMAQRAADQVAAIIEQYLINPLMTAIINGATATAAINQVLTQANIDAMIAGATTAIQSLTQIFNDPAFKAAMEQFKQAIHSVGAFTFGATAGVGGGLLIGGKIWDHYPTYEELNGITGGGTSTSAASDATKLLTDRLALLAQIAELTGDKAQAAAVLEQQRAIALAALDPSLVDLTKQLWALQDAAKAAAAVKQFADSLQKFLDDMKLSDVSPLTNRQKLDAAHEKYVDDLMKAQAGDVDARGRFTSDAQTYLQQALAVFGRATPDYINIFRAVEAQTQGLLGQAQHEASLTDVNATISSGQATAKQQMTDLIDRVDKTNARLDAIYAETQRNTNVTKEGAQRQADVTETSARDTRDTIRHGMTSPGRLSTT